MDQLSLRDERETDQAFLLQLFASDRPELALPDPAGAAVLLQLQWRGQQLGYHARFPRLEARIVERAGVALGRLQTARSDTEIRLVELCLLPLYQGQGIGSRLLGMLLEQGARDGLPVRLSVHLEKRARQLYQRLGFVALADDGVYQSMEWLPATPRKAHHTTRIHHATQTIHPGR